MFCNRNRGGPMAGVSYAGSSCRSFHSVLTCSMSSLHVHLSIRIEPAIGGLHLSSSFDCSASPASGFCLLLPHV
ncbi:hypothetical protein VUR80DRAFT_4792 [Thermomyces stellatus]